MNHSIELFRNIAPMDLKILTFESRNSDSLDRHDGATAGVNAAVSHATGWRERHLRESTASFRRN